MGEPNAACHLINVATSNDSKIDMSRDDGVSISTFPAVDTYQLFQINNIEGICRQELSNSEVRLAWLPHEAILTCVYTSCRDVPRSAKWVALGNFEFLREGRICENQSGQHQEVRTNGSS
jgi:hypothetical protein